MSRHHRFKLNALALAAATVLLGACQTAALQSPTATSAAAALSASPVLRQDAFQGIYEVAVSADATAVFVATITGFDPQNGGFIHRLDARSLQTLQTTQTPRRSFALGLNRSTNTLYVGNTMEGSLSIVDASSGVVKGVIQLAEAKQDAEGKTSYAHTRKVIVDEKHNRVFVTSPGQPGLIWIVDGATNTLTHTITSEGIWTAGAAYDAGSNRLYVSQGGVHEILEIDPDAGKVVRSFSTGDSTANTSEGAKHFFINLAIDTKGQRLFSTDANTSQVYVFDIASGSVVKQIPIDGISLLDVVYNPQRDEIVTTHRGAARSAPTGTGAVTLIDAATYAVKRTIDLPMHPNSLALTPDGQTLYVTVKAPHGDKHPGFRKDALDSVVRIDLR
ncbi:YncE family protein [Pseudothauera nasutitermitis]|uniref:YncE family protein n=1 Tax=Pseudothauera nasutitermitis TaxID=2565930 RepID=A0A4S4B1V3_9RHOO|nr:YncE family protein [Pseudothauera nasutitermitis]THF66554.1 YncE family protein [Pseudothauera nasutitermitis]